MPSDNRSSDDGQTPLGIELDGDGAHPAAWRFAGHGPAELLDPARLGRTVRAAETAGFSFATLAARRPGDGFPNIQGRLDPVELAAYLAALTSRIGLVVETSADGAEPFHLANRLASLDLGLPESVGRRVPERELVQQ
ncbi:LLM class flavin-dependent oxidoreductase [Cellulomonas sp. URHD0024]|uniref:LLM class flavin-dependent oxidoreductase n=1 Tax=Cellulomonas sp. URHD0024 TaxID=1302620 RepID=UPI00040F70F3|nr:LLM class flavin-dependent oxidoreductase [Cellulomonas sp. URHD0024]